MKILNVTTNNYKQTTFGNAYARWVNVAGETRFMSRWHDVTTGKFVSRETIRKVFQELDSRAYKVSAQAGEIQTGRKTWVPARDMDWLNLVVDGDDAKATENAASKGKEALNGFVQNLFGGNVPHIVRLNSGVKVDTISPSIVKYLV